METFYRRAWESVGSKVLMVLKADPGHDGEPQSVRASFLLLSPSSHPRSCVSSVVLESWHRELGSSCCGEERLFQSHTVSASQRYYNNYHFTTRSYDIQSCVCRGGWRFRLSRCFHFLVCFSFSRVFLRGNHEKMAVHGKKTEQQDESSL